MIYLIVGPFGLFILFRVLLPIMWCIDFLVNNLSSKYYELIVVHLIYLLTEGILLILLMIYIVNLVSKYRKYRANKIYERKKNNSALKYAFFTSFLILLFFVLNFNTLPIFMKGGSDAIVALGEQQKTKTWFMYGILGTLNTALLISVIYLKTKKKKYIYGFILLLASLVTGKKSALIGFLSKFVFAYFLLNNKKPNLPILKLLIGLLLSILFIVYQFSKTAGFDFDIFQVFSILFHLIYSSSTVYLQQIIIEGGIEYAPMYSDLLGDGGSIIYILNPFMKFIFGIGIYKAPGPFLGEMLYGYTFPNGVNPTLFFEPIFVFGSYMAIFFSFLNLFIVIKLAKYFIKKVIYNVDSSILLTTGYIGLFFSSLSFLIDTLNTARNIPFVILPILFFYVYKALLIISRRKHV